MKALKFLGQILSAIVYTCLFTGVMYLVLIYPLAWILSLPPFWTIAVFLILGGLIEGLQITLQTFATLPYKWIVNKNIVSLVISIILILFIMIRSDVILWKDLSSQGTIAIIFAVIATILIIQFVVGAISCIVGLYSEFED